MFREYYNFMLNIKYDIFDKMDDTYIVYIILRVNK